MIDEVGYSSDQGSTDDERSDRVENEWLLSPHNVFRNMLHVATCMSQKDRQQQKVLLSLAIQAIEKVEEDSRSDVERKRKRQETAEDKDTAKKEMHGRPLGSLSPASSRYVLWLQNNGNFEDEEMFEEPKPDGAEELESEIGWSNQTVHRP
jgi:hypothetical protein